MNSLPDPVTLAGLQAQFAAALRAEGDERDAAVGALAVRIVDDGLAPASRLQVYRNNVRAMFDGALERTYPVLRRRVGGARFRALARAYHTAHPSRSGDLHWIGEAFPGWLDSQMAGGDETWLADLARLEWACEEALVAERRTALDPPALAAVPPEELADTGLALQPCLRAIRSKYPVWSAWRAGQPGSSEDPPEASQGPQYVVVACRDEGLVLHSVPPDQFRFVVALADGQPLGAALESADLDVARLPDALAWLFTEGLVVALRRRGPGRTPGERP